MPNAAFTGNCDGFCTCIEGDSAVAACRFRDRAYRKLSLWRGRGGLDGPVDVVVQIGDHGSRGIDEAGDM
jgi:hypothetical protein